MLRVGLAIVGGAAGAIATYALLRIGQKLVTGDADPALVLYSEHAGYFWRSWTAAYAGGMIAFILWLFAGRDPARVARVLAAAVPIAAALIALQGLLVP